MPGGHESNPPGVTVKERVTLSQPLPLRSDTGVASRSPPPIPVSYRRHRVPSFRSPSRSVVSVRHRHFAQAEREKDDGELHFAAFAFDFGRARLASFAGFAGFARFGAASSRAQLAGSGSSAVAAASTASMS